MYISLSLYIYIYTCIYIYIYIFTRSVRQPGVRTKPHLSSIVLMTYLMFATCSFRRPSIVYHACKPVRSSCVQHALLRWSAST